MFWFELSLLYMHINSCLKTIPWSSIAYLITISNFSDTNQGVYARAVLKENAKFMLVMENGSKEGKDQNIKRAFSAQPG